MIFTNLLAVPHDLVLPMIPIQELKWDTCEFAVIGHSPAKRSMSRFFVGRKLLL